MNYENSNLGGKYNNFGFEIGLPLADIYLVLVYYNYFFQHHIKVKTHIFFRSAPKFFFSVWDDEWYNKWLFHSRTTAKKNLSG